MKDGPALLILDLQSQFLKDKIVSNQCPASNGAVKIADGNDLQMHKFKTFFGQIKALLACFLFRLRELYHSDCLTCRDGARYISD